MTHSYIENIDVGNVKSMKIDEKNFKVMADDFVNALKEVRPSFGQDEDTFEPYLRGGIIDYGAPFRSITERAQQVIGHIRDNPRTSLVSILLEGASGSGKSALAAHIAKMSGFPFVKLIAPHLYIGNTELQKTMAINRVFEDAYKSSYSVIVLDEIEKLIGMF